MNYRELKENRDDLLYKEAEKIGGTFCKSYDEREGLVTYSVYDSQGNLVYYYVESSQN